MKNVYKTISTTAAFLVASTLAQANFAQTSVTAATPVQADAATPAQSAAKEMTDAEVRKVDANNGKITLKHGFIKSLDMPGMTMIFSTKDKAMLDGLSTGDKVQFAVEIASGKFTVTEIKKLAP